MKLAQMHAKYKEGWQKEVERRILFDEGTFGPADPDSDKQYTRSNRDVHANPPGYLGIDTSLRSFLDWWRKDEGARYAKREITAEAKEKHRETAEGLDKEFLQSEAAVNWLALQGEYGERDQEQS